MLILRRILKKVYWFGCIGFIGTLFQVPILELFYLFFLAAILDVILSFIIILKSNSELEEVSHLKLLFQSLGIMIGIPIIYIKNGFRLPNITNYTPLNSYRLPFHDEWLAVNGGIDKEHSHSWKICNQRYAYDFIIMTNGLSHSGEGSLVTDYYCYDQLILACADGVVVEIKNLFEDTPVSKDPIVQCSASDARGNYIVIQHENGEYSTVAHIKKDSFLVTIGKKVKQGEAIARCGNSGNTSEPHIHFHVQQGQSFLFNASIPLYFNGIETALKKSIHFITAGEFVKNK